ncbi:MAG: phenylacetic acid degradation operon negative regulatory protein PaaX [Chloroflexi bacterium]|nr:phenylacetic acid degradation operon negative regulatory protein PaaX [Chloroflexota bacterium]
MHYKVKSLNGLRPQSMVITLYGDYIRHVEGSIQIGALVQLLSYFGVSNQAVRSAVSRMKRNGVLRVERKAARSLYSLSAKSAKTVEEGAVRIFQFPSRHGSWDGQWHLITYSIPESAREARDRLRQELSWMGFGMLTNGLWVSPHDHDKEIATLAESLGIRSRMEIFTARHDGFSTPQTIAQHCWDLKAINARYTAFLKRFQPLYDEHCRLLSQGGDIEPSEYFVRRFNLIHEFRRFPFLDPELPIELLPADWCGAQAADLFRQYHDLLANKAIQFFTTVCQNGK